MSSESVLPYDGPLSTYREWDALLYGLAVGALLSIRRVRRDIRREPSKFIAAVVLTATIIAFLRGDECGAD
jgi:hypothetical protein